MQALKPNDVLARVVAWHNRHPLARRIQPTQVHSIGAVALPFASNQALPMADGAAQGQAEPQIQTLPHGQGLRRRSPPPGLEPAAAAELTASLAAPEPGPAIEQAPEAAPDAEPGQQPQEAALRSMEEADDPLAPVEAPAQHAAEASPDAQAEADAGEPSGPDALVSELDEGATPEGAKVDEVADEADAEDSPPAAEQTDPDADADDDDDEEPSTLEAEFVMAGEAPDTPADEASAATPAVPVLAEAAADAGKTAETAESADERAPEPALPTGAPAASEDPPAPSSAQNSEAEDLAPDLAAPEHRVQASEATEAAQPDRAAAATDAPEADPTSAPPLATRLQAAKAAALAAESDPAADPMPTNAASALPNAMGATLGLTAPRSWWHRLWPWGGQSAGAASPAAKAARESKPAKLVALFNAKFLWPLSPQRVADWARDHAALSPMAPADWPRRDLQAEPGLLQQARSKGQRHTGQLHVLTAAIGVGDRRIRVLIGADGQVLGPRAIDKRRVAVVAGVTLFMATVVAARWPHHEAADAEALPAEAAASAPAPPALAMADAPASAASGVQSASVNASASAAGGDHGAAAHGADAHAAAELPAAAVPAPQEDGHGAHAEAATPTTTTTAEAASSAPAALTVTSTPPPRFPERRASGPLANIRPQLSAEERLVARQQSEAARGTAQGKAPAQAEPSATSPVAANLRFAVVTLGSSQREPAEAYLAQLLSVRAQMPSPGTARTELVQQKGQWRAALWPFATVGDAERARTMLATRGLKTEVVAF